MGTGAAPLRAPAIHGSDRMPASHANGAGCVMVVFGWCMPYSASAQFSSRGECSTCAAALATREYRLPERSDTFARLLEMSRLASTLLVGLGVTALFVLLNRYLVANITSLLDVPTWVTRALDFSGSLVTVMSVAMVVLNLVTTVAYVYVLSRRASRDLLHHERALPVPPI